MAKQKESGKEQLVKGSLRYAWEELKTLNGKKIKALGTILGGYLRVKFGAHKKVKNERPLDTTTDLEEDLSQFS